MIRKRMLGKKLSNEQKNKISLSLKGKTPKNLSLIAGWNKGIKTPESIRIKQSLAHKGKIAEKSSHWKGEKVSYLGLHGWIRNRFGRKNKCDIYGTINAKRFEWANKDHKYRRNREDWMCVCTVCHAQYEKK